MALIIIGLVACAYIGAKLPWQVVAAIIAAWGIVMLATHGGQGISW